MKNGVFHLKT